MTWRQLARRSAVFVVAALVVNETVGIALDAKVHHVFSGAVLGSVNEAVSVAPAVLIVGSSTAVHHFDDQALTSALGIRVYNAGADGRGVVFGRGVTALVCQHEHLKAVVVDVRKNRQELARAEPSLSPYVDDSAVVRSILDHDWPNRIMLNVRSFHYNGAALPVLANMRSRQKDNEWGFRPLDAVSRPEQASAAPETHAEDDDLGWYADQVAALVDESRACGARVLFVQSPVAVTTALQLEIVAVFQSIAAGRGVPYVDLGVNHPELLDPGLFVDNVHLNAGGARLATSALEQVLRGELQMLPRRN